MNSVGQPLKDHTGFKTERLRERYLSVRRRHWSSSVARWLICQPNFAQSGLFEKCLAKEFWRLME